MTNSCIIMQESCICCSKLAKAIPALFHQHSETLAKPLLKSMVHQHSKVRVASIKVITSYTGLFVFVFFFLLFFTIHNKSLMIMLCAWLVCIIKDNCVMLQSSYTV